MLTDTIGRPTIVYFTPGNRSDVTAAKTVLAKAPSLIRRLIADRGYDADWLRRALREQNTLPIIPEHKNRKCGIRHDKKRYRDHWWIEASFGHLKDFRRIATCEACPPASKAGPGGQARRQLCLSRDARLHRRLLALIGSGT